jgi:hypothetical protein
LLKLPDLLDLLDLPEELPDLLLLDLSLANLYFEDLFLLLDDLLPDFFELLPEDLPELLDLPLPDL